VAQRFLPKHTWRKPRPLKPMSAQTRLVIRIFFILFGCTVKIEVIKQKKVVAASSIILGKKLLVRLLYLSLYLKKNVYPEMLFIPRGLITILLFYKIPAALRLAAFNYSVLFFVILVTGFIMTLGVVFYRKQPDDLPQNDC
jgi:hypothetical protein